MSQTAVYVRLSQNRLGDEDKPDRQRKACADFLARQGISESVEYLDDDVSAYKGKPRPAWLRLLAAIEAGHVTHVVALHMDRLLRSMGQLEQLVDLVEQTGVKIETVESGALDLTTSAGRQQARILSAITTGESERKAERHKSKAAQLREQGKSTGGARPFGWESPNGDLEPFEADLIRSAIRQVIDGATIYSIRQQWVASGAKTSMNGEWGNNKSIVRILTRWRNAGLVEHQGQIVGPAVWPAIVTQDEVAQVRAILSDPDRRTTPGPTRRHLLSGIMTCSNCGSEMRKAKGGRQEDYYRCSGPGCYLSIQQKAADDYVNSSVALIFTFTDPSQFASDPKDRERLAEMRAERASIASQSEEVAALVGQGGWTVKVAQIALQGFSERIAEIERELAFISSRIATAEMLTEPAMNLDTHVVDLDKATAVKEKWLGMDLEKKRAILRELFSEIVVSPGRASQRITLTRK